VIILKTFYIFKLNNNILSIAKSNSYNIYLLLNTIYRYNKKDIMIAFNLFDELCLPINYNFFNKYIYERLIKSESYTKFQSIHMFHDYINDEESKMIVKKSHIKIKSNKEKNVFIENIRSLKDLFICDFNNDFYLLTGYELDVKKSSNLKNFLYK